MSMTTCRECGGEISTTARACPKCGAVVPRPKIWPWVVGAPLVLFLLMLVYGSTIPDYVHEAREARKMCEQLAPMQKDECRRIEERAIAEGKARGDK